MVKLLHKFETRGDCRIYTHLNYMNRNYSVREGARVLSWQLKAMCKTKPATYGAKCAALISTCYDQREKLDNFDRTLGMVVRAINLNTQAEKYKN